MRSRSVLAHGTSATLGLTFSLAGVTTSSAAPSHHVTAHISKAASRGGRVIIVLRNQMKNVKVEQNNVRTAATRTSQLGITKDLAAHGATNISYLVSVNAIAATVSSKEISRLRSNSSVAGQNAVTSKATGAVSIPAQSLSTNGDVSGPYVYIPAGASALVTGTLTPTAASGTAVPARSPW